MKVEVVEINNEKFLQVLGETPQDAVILEKMLALGVKAKRLILFGREASYALQLANVTSNELYQFALDILREMQEMSLKNDVMEGIATQSQADSERVNIWDTEQLLSLNPEAPLFHFLGKRVRITYSEVGETSTEGEVKL